MLFKIFQILKENSVYVKDHVEVTLLLGAVVLVLVLYKWQNRKKLRLPPGPIGLPILGYYPFVKKDPVKAIDKVAKKYGKVVGFYVGPKYVVVLNDWEAVTEALSQNSSLNRTPSPFPALPFSLGFTEANGAEWVETRRLSSKAMKDVGLHSAKWEELIQEETTELVQRITEEGQRPVDVRSHFADYFSSTIVTLVLGQRLSVKHPFVKTVTVAVDAIIENMAPFAMINFSQTLSTVLQNLGLEKKFIYFKEVLDFGKSISDIVNEKLRNPDLKSDDSFIAHYQEEAEKFVKNNPKPYITDENLKGNVISLILGGSETSRTSIIWALISMANLQDIQRKVHEELDREIGKDGLIKYADRFKIPYTFATILESMRHSTVGPFPAMRHVSEDMKVQGYYIPKGTYLVSNIWSLHNDPKYWSNPDQFIPERFLVDDGKKVNASPESFDAFSYGKRNCPGKLIGLMTILQYFTIFMQKFKVMPAEGDKVKHGTQLGITYQATNVQLRFIPR